MINKDMSQVCMSSMTTMTKNSAPPLQNSIESLAKAKTMGRKGSLKNQKPPKVDPKAQTLSSKENTKPINSEISKMSTPIIKGSIDSLLSKMEELGMFMLIFIRIRMKKHIK
jgi:hypothetical protein